MEDRNAGYWRIVTTLDQEIPSAWVTHATRKRAKRAKAAAMAAAAASEIEESAGADGPQQQSKPVPMPWLPGVRGPLPPRGPFGDRVDRVFFFGDLNYRVDLSREDLELGVSACRRQQAAEGAGEGEGKRGGEEKARGRRISERFRPGEERDRVERMLGRNLGHRSKKENGRHIILVKSCVVERFAVLHGLCFSVLKRAGHVADVCLKHNKFNVLFEKLSNVSSLLRFVLKREGVGPLTRPTLTTAVKTGSKALSQAKSASGTIGAPYRLEGTLR